MCLPPMSPQQWEQKMRATIFVILIIFAVCGMPGGVLLWVYFEGHAEMGEILL